MADSLSLDLCREILLHLPVKSLIRFTAVSKSWRSLITSRDFIYAHLSNSKTQTLLFNGYGSVHVLAASTGVRPCYEPRFPNVPRLKNSRVVGSSGGLVCLSATNLFIREYNSIVIWNPSVGHHVFLKQPITITERAHPPTLGFGVANHVYKIVRIVHGHDPVVYTLGTGRWRSVEGFEFADRSEIIGPQTLLKGVLHWLYCEPGRKNSCLTFEIGDEVFSKVMLPDVLGREEEVSLSSIEGSLAVVAVKYSHYVSDDIHVWVMKESWIKLCSIDLGNLGKWLNGEVLLIKREGRVVGFRNGEAIIAFEGMNLVGYNLKTGKAKDLGVSGFYSLFYIDDYVESLLVPVVLKNDSRTSLSDPFFLFA